MKDVVARIASYMEMKGYTSSSFADALGMNRPTVLHILNGRNKPNLNLIISLAQLDPALDLRLLLTGTPSDVPTDGSAATNPQELPFDEPYNSPTPVVETEIKNSENQSDKNETSEREYIYVLKPDGTYATYRREAL